MTTPTSRLTSANARPACPTCGRPTKIIHLYCRISQDYDGDGGMRSVDEQEIDGRLSIADQGVCCYVVGTVWKDPAKSAWRKKLRRPDFEKMMAALEAGLADGVWVYDITRFSRKPMEGERLIEAAERGIVVLSSNKKYDLKVDDDRRTFRVAMADAAYESDRISRRSKRGKRLKANRGQSNASFRGFARPGDGFDVIELAREQAIVSEVVDLILARRSVDSCAELMNERGFRTINGLPWDGGSLKQMLKSPTLCGRVEYAKKMIEGKRLAGTHALSEEKWDSLMELFASRSRGVPADVYLLSGIARCGRCGSVLYGRPETSKKPYSEGRHAGEQRRSYWCQPIKRQRGFTSGCGGLSIDWAFLDHAVKMATIMRLSDRRNAERVVAEAEANSERRAELEAQIDEDVRRGQDMSRKNGSGEMPDKFFLPWITAHTKKLSDLQKELDALPAVKRSSDRDPEKAAEDWANGTLGERRGMVMEAFPNLTILPAVRGRWGAPDLRIDWHGEALSLI